MSSYDLDNRQGNQFQYLGFTDTPLLAGIDYTSALYFSTTFLFVSGLCKADQAGYLVIQFSPNDTPLILGETVKTYVANDPLNFKVYITAPYFRVKFINGVAPQASFYMYWYGAIE